MEVMWKVFSCEGKQYRFKKQHQGKKTKQTQNKTQQQKKPNPNKPKNLGTLPRKTEVNIQQQKDIVTTDKLVNEQSGEELWLLFSKYKVESVLFIFAFFKKLSFDCHSEKG